MEALTKEEALKLGARELMNKMEEVRQLAIETGANWAEAQSQYKALKEMMPSFLAEFQRSYYEPGSTISEARMRALADFRYIKKLEAMTQAERQANLLETQYRSLIESIKAISAISYLRNQEAKLERGM